MLDFRINPKHSLAALAAGFAFLASTSAAQADVVTTEGTKAVLTGTEGPDSVGYQIFDGQLIISGSDLVMQTSVCNQPFAGGNVECPVSAIKRLEVRTLGGDDRVHGSLYATTEQFAHVDLGAGDDYIETSGADVVLGGPGNDEMRGWSQAMDNVFEGGEGDDKLTGGPGADILRGGPGNDELVGEGGTDEHWADVLDGGEGVDTVDDWFHADAYDMTPAVVTLDGKADDGVYGEGDNVTAVEKIRAGTGVIFRGTDGPEEVIPTEVGGKGSMEGLGGADFLKGTDDSETIDGGAGDDVIRAGYGNDTITGGPGRDEIQADRTGRCNEMHCDLSPGSAADVIDAVDGEVDTISCGPGNDVAKVDAIDVVAADCETVEVKGAKPGEVVTPGGGNAAARVAVVGSASLKSLRRGKLRVAVAGQTPGAAVKVSALKGAKAIATGSSRADTAGVATVTLKLTKKGKRAVRKAKALKLTIVAGSERLAVSLKR